MKRWRQGREGEIDAAEYLDDLIRKGCYVFHSLPVQVDGHEYDIDHVIISTWGVFTVETKAYSRPSHGETVATFDGQSIKFADRKPDPAPVIQALIQAKWLEDKIKETTGERLSVTPIIVLLKWMIPKEQMKHDGIWVVNPSYLVGLITRLAMTLTDEEVTTFADVVRPLTQASRVSP